MKNLPMRKNKDKIQEIQVSLEKFKNQYYSAKQIRLKTTDSKKKVIHYW